jgi:hypothetical protein
LMCALNRSRTKGSDAVIKMRVWPLTGTYRRTWKPPLGAKRATVRYKTVRGKGPIERIR